MCPIYWKRCFLADCPAQKSCVNQKCVNPCPGPCALNAECRVINHSPICSCPSGYTGSPFIHCEEIPPSKSQIMEWMSLQVMLITFLLSTEPAYLPPPAVKRDPCQPSPCGQYSQCRNVNDQAICSCLPQYYGSPPQCHPECTIHQDCLNDRACINEKCIDPCPGACGINALCKVTNHIPICFCQEGYEGNPFSSCSKISKYFI